MARDTLLDVFDDLGRTPGDFLIYDDGYRARSYAYGQVARAARGFAARLQASKLGKGDKVLFWGENRPEWLVAFWGCLLAGVVVVPIDYRASLDFLRRVHAITGARLLLLGDEVAPEAVRERAAPGLLDGTPRGALRTSIGARRRGPSRSRSRAVMSPRSSSPPAPRRSQKAW